MKSETSQPTTRNTGFVFPSLADLRIYLRVNTVGHISK